MTVTALVISLVAGIAAVVSVLYTAKQARDAGIVRKIDEARRHDELTPTITGVYLDPGPYKEVEIGGRKYTEEVGPEDRAIVRLTNGGKLDLDRIGVNVIPAHKLHEKIIEGIYDYRTRDAMPNTETGRLPREASWDFEVVHGATDDGPLGGIVKFRCTCHAKGQEPWDVVVEVQFPYPAFLERR